MILSKLISNNSFMTSKSNLYMKDYTIFIKRKCNVKSRKSLRWLTMLIQSLRLVEIWRKTDLKPISNLLEIENVKMERQWMRYYMKTPKEDGINKNRKIKINRDLRMNKFNQRNLLLAIITLNLLLKSLRRNSTSWYIR